MAYLLDANIFIQAKNLHYGFDFCPAFWSWITLQNTVGTVFSIARVRDELLEGTDELSDWARSQGDTFFLEPDATVVPALRQVSSWVVAQQYDAAAVSTFLQVADYWLVAHALAAGRTVVTHEQPSSSTRKIKIPDVCLGLGVSFTTPFAMLRREQARFVLGT
jgi:predicted nucleic acid-binding protein